MTTKQLILPRTDSRSINTDILFSVLCSEAIPIKSKIFSFSQTGEPGFEIFDLNREYGMALSKINHLFVEMHRKVLRRTYDSTLIQVL
jgi:hypothetical protein